MGSYHRVVYDLTPAEGIIMCRRCRTHIARDRDVAALDALGITYERVVNVMVDGPQHYWGSNNNTLANIYCVECRMHLGTKIINPKKEDMYFYSPQDFYIGLGYGYNRFNMGKSAYNIQEGRSYEYPLKLVI